MLNETIYIKYYSSIANGTDLDGSARILRRPPVAWRPSTTANASGEGPPVGHGHVDERLSCWRQDRFQPFRGADDRFPDGRPAPRGSLARRARW
jgi:hypothetical protein